MAIVRRNFGQTNYFKFRLAVNQVSDLSPTRIPFYKILHMLHQSSKECSRYSLDTFLDEDYNLTEYYRALVIKAFRHSLRVHNSAYPVDSTKISEKIEIETPRTFLNRLAGIFVH